LLDNDLDDETNVVRFFSLIVALLNLCRNWVLDCMLHTYGWTARSCNRHRAYPELVAMSIMNAEKSAAAALLKDGSLALHVGGELWHFHSFMHLFEHHLDLLECLLAYLHFFLSYPTYYTSGWDILARFVWSCLICKYVPKMPINKLFVRMMTDGREGWPEFASYDAIHDGAMSPKIRKPLIDQLKPGEGWRSQSGTYFRNSKWSIRMRMVL